MSFILQCENYHRHTFSGSSTPVSKTLVLSLSAPLPSLMSGVVASNTNSSWSCINPSAVAEVDMAGPDVCNAIGEEVV
jgi:hypothetical protein